MMTINNTLHINLIQDELTFRTNEFEKLLKKQAAKMFMDNQLYLCRYQGFDEARGNLIVRFDHKICLPPRRNESFQSFVSEIQNDNVRNWGGMTYQDLRTRVSTQFECSTVFFKYDSDHTIVGLSGVKLEDVEKYHKDALVFLGPTDPPLNYLINLLNFLKVENTDSNDILSIKVDNASWSPEPLIMDENIVAKLQLDFASTDNIIIQGPPGTGKTFLMAKVCSALLRADYKILVTALTNRALIELAEKEHLKKALEQGKVYKTALSADESKNKKVKGLQALKSLRQQKPQMLLSSYYIMSQLAIKAVEGAHFDYIIIEEASQAFLATIALAKKLGKKCIIIGDIKQLEPIFHKEYPEENVNHYHWMVCGLKAISYYLNSSKQYILTDSYRLTKNSVRATNAFYSGKLISKSDVRLPLDFSEQPQLARHLNKNGGPSVKTFDLPDGKIPSQECMQFIIDCVSQIKEFDHRSEIAILAYNRDSVRYLQKEIFSKCVHVEDVLVETIDRIQGLTTDFCLFFIPLESYPSALQANRFNVATSRAKLCTLLLTDCSIEHIDLLPKEVNRYLQTMKALEK